MKLRDYRIYFARQLEPIYGREEAESFFAIALEELKGWKRSDLALNPEEALTEAEQEKWDEVLQQLLLQRPIQYIFGETRFYGLDFKVNENTLIPRQETEELAEWIITEYKGSSPVSILDIGTGSGCIAIALAKNLPQANVTAMDISESALAVAKHNAKSNNVPVSFIQQDILTAESLQGSFDVIVSNPPYVRNLEKAEIKDNVLRYEPHLALFVEDNDPLVFYRKISRLAKASLITNGALYFEINQYLGNETVEMLKQEGFASVTLKKDIYGNDRMVKAVL